MSKYLSRPIECVVPHLNVQIRQFYLFGSKAAGPYHKNVSESDQMRLVNSLTRLPSLLKEYFKLFGPPERIVFNVLAWDLVPQCGGDLAFKPGTECSLDTDFLATFVANFNARVDQIIDATTLTSGGEVGVTNIALRTSPWLPWGGPMMRAMNDVIRNIAAERKLELFDLDMHIWSKVNFDANFESHLFADNIHPRGHLQSHYAEIMLERRYSKFAKFDHQPWLHQAVRSHLTGSKGDWISLPLIRRKSTIADETMADLFFFDPLTRLRYHIPCEGFLRNLFLGPSDALAIDFIDEIELGPAIPRTMFEPGNILIRSLHSKHPVSVAQRHQRPESHSSLELEPSYFLVTTCADFPLASWVCLYSLPTAEAAGVLIHPKGNTLNVTDGQKQWLKLLSSPYHVPNVLANNTLLQWPPSKVVHLLRDGKLHVISNAGVMEALGRGFDEVVRLDFATHSRLLSLFRRGDDLN